MPFGTSWHTLLEECEALDDEATPLTPLTETEFRISDVQEHRIVITETDTDDVQALQRDQCATLADRIGDAGGTFQLQRLLPDAEPYAAVLSLHPRYEFDTRGERSQKPTSQRPPNSSPELHRRVTTTRIGPSPISMSTPTCSC